MKKSNKKQKLIIAIAITLIIIILAIVFTTNIISNNNKIANEEYLATTANASSNLVASYIKKEITIGGITGTLETLDTSDATATAADIAKGKTAYVNGVKITGTYVEKDTLGTVTGNETTNSEVNDKYGNPVKVPAGFKVVNPNDDVTDGIIIEDVSAGDENTKGSQFVWIPVGDVITDANGSTTKIELGRYTFSSNGKTLVQSAENGNWSNEVAISSYYKELSTSRYGNATAKSLENFVTKTLATGGYYIGRYEAGDALAIDIARKGTINVSNSSNPIACKASIYPYNYVNQKDASDLCQEMYKSDTNSNFQSDLINSYAWDTAIVFIQTFSGDENYSKQVGENTETSLQRCGESTLATVESGDESKDVRCNIYDMAGNTMEWNTEAYSYSNGYSVSRGGYYQFASYTSIRSGIDKDTANDFRSFRPTLYL